MPQVKWTSQAVADLEEVAFYIAYKDKRPSTADRVVDNIQQAVQLYATQPGGCRRIGTR